MTGEAELWYGLIIMGLSIPPFVHYARVIIRRELPAARRGLADMRRAAREDLERTRQLLRRH